MAHRPVLGVLAAFLMTNATLGGTAMACSAAGAQAEHATEHLSATPAAASHDHHTSASVPPVPADDGPSAPSDAPSVPNCCKALAPCTSAATVAGVLTIAVPVSRDGNFMILGARAPASLNTAPEPPPPKA